MIDSTQGWINLYKPKKISSFLAIKKIKNKFKIHKIGHAGTLDPLAEGILPIGIGKTTKLIPFIQNKKKKYIFTIKWGYQTSTDDTEGEIIKSNNIIPTDDQIRVKLNSFIGKINQTPPHASAVKVNGKRAYSLLRKGSNFLLKPKKVYIKKILLLNSQPNATSCFFVESGMGFYVRSFARDLAISLGAFGHVLSLKRTNVGLFSLKTAILLDDLLKIGQTQFEFNCIHDSMSMLDDILAYEIENEDDLNDLSMGKSIKINSDKLILPPLSSIDKNLVFLSKNGKVISFGEFNGDLFKPKKILI